MYIINSKNSTSFVTNNNYIVDIIMDALRGDLLTYYYLCVCRDVLFIIAHSAISCLWKGNLCHLFNTLVFNVIGAKPLS